MPLEDALNHDPEDIISGHNGEKQTVTVRETRVVRDPSSGRQCMERVCSDELGNWYLVYSAQLQDGELYDVCDWVKPSAIEHFGGFNDSLIDAFREKAFGVFKKTSENIQVARAIEQAGAKIRDEPGIIPGVNLAGRN